MKNTRYIATAIGLVAAVVMWGQAELSGNFEPFFPLSTEIGSFSSLLGARTSTALPSPDARRAWAVFENYLEFARTHNSEGIMSLSHSPSATCSNPELRERCISLMNTGYSRGSAMQKENFVHAWSDEKQIILSTEYTPLDLQAMNARGRSRSIIYFSKDESGEPKLIGFNPFDAVFINTGNTSPPELDLLLDEMTLDSDKDGLTDASELCLTERGTKIHGCEETDPYDPDTNGDGWWDGIEALFR